MNRPASRAPDDPPPDDWFDLAFACVICGVAVVCIACAFFGLVQP